MKAELAIKLKANDSRVSIIDMYTPKLCTESTVGVVFYSETELEGRIISLHDSGTITDDDMEYLRDAGTSIYGKNSVIIY